uniref:Nucleoside triphosphate pyrophosphohydrolase n=1 Tax=candidate division WOR-3 bacterium TaxID=2052148 RepID=A0A7V3RGA1_UNCW3
MKKRKNLRNTNKFSELVKLVRTLRKRCPWDRKQTLNTMKNNVIEEAYEVVNAIETKDQDGIKEEIGDLLFLGIFLGQLMEGWGVSLDEIIVSTIDKYRRKHPHVFKSKKFKNVKEIVKYWHGSKNDIFEGIPLSLPTLLAARLIQERAARVGFDWIDANGPIEKLIEEIDELKRTKRRNKIKEEMGDILFSCVNVARHLKIDPEEALRMANKKFVRRFRLMQKRLQKEKKNLSELSIEEMDHIWNEIKKNKN